MRGVLFSDETIDRELIEVQILRHLFERQQLLRHVVPGLEQWTVPVGMGSVRTSRIADHGNSARSSLVQLHKARNILHRMGK